MPDHPLVTAVIPTRNRPNLVRRAVQSALDQTLANLEVKVVVDGPDPSTATGLQAISDPRLSVIELPQSVGGSAARNAGAEAARGEWIAFLDDDDEWLPHKLATQMELAGKSKFPYPIIGAQVIARDSEGDKIWPRSNPREPLSEYLLSRRSWSFGEGLMSTTTLVARRDLVLKCGFSVGLKRYQDWDWLLRAIRVPGAGVEFAAEPLAIWHRDPAQPSISRSYDWRHAVDWIQGMRDLVTPRAYAGFIAGIVAPAASSEPDWRAFPQLFWEMIRRGSPSPFDLALYFGMWLPKNFRRKLAQSTETASRTSPCAI